MENQKSTKTNVSKPVLYYGLNEGRLKGLIVDYITVLYPTDDSKENYQDNLIENMGEARLARCFLIIHISPDITNTSISRDDIINGVLHLRNQLRWFIMQRTKTMSKEKDIVQVREVQKNAYVVILLIPKDVDSLDVKNEFEVLKREVINTAFLKGFKVIVHRHEWVIDQISLLALTQAITPGMSLISAVHIRRNKIRRNDNDPLARVTSPLVFRNGERND